EIGYKEIEPIEPTAYGGLDPKQFRAFLDRYKLRAPSTHTKVYDGPGLERALAVQQIMGFKYTQIEPPDEAPGNQKASAKTPEPAVRPRRTTDSVKQGAEQYNRWGNIASKFGMKIFIHHHSVVFDRLADGELSPYDVLVAETDPAVVTMQIDIGWATIAG